VALEPVFVNKTKRASWMLELADGVQVECALDTASCSAATAGVQVRELELEMKEGDPARLYELARQVHEALPVRIENVSKAERGYALAGAVAPRAVKAAAVSLKRKASMGEALAAILRNCLEQMQANEHGVLAGEVESLHQMRVGLRRLRAAMAMVRDLVQLPAPLAGDVEWLAGELGDARNWDVFIESLLPGLPLPDEHKPALARVEAAAREEAERHRARVRGAVGSPRYTGLMLGLGAWVIGQGWKQSGRADGPPPAHWNGRWARPRRAWCSTPPRACASAPATSTCSSRSACTGYASPPRRSAMRANSSKRLATARRKRGATTC
jgi:triphosphatase